MLTKLKAEIDKINVDKLKAVPADLSNLNNEVNEEVVSKTVYNKLVAKINNIGTSGFVLTLIWMGFLGVCLRREEEITATPV